MGHHDSVRLILAETLPAEQGLLLHCVCSAGTSALARKHVEAPSKASDAPHASARPSLNRMVASFAELQKEERFWLAEPGSKIVILAG